MLLAHKVVNRKQFHTRHAECQQVVNDRFVCDAGVRSTLVIRHGWVQRREALHVSFVDDRVAPRHRRPSIARPVVVVGHDY